jgi:hypothetical protein
VTNFTAGKTFDNCQQDAMLRPPFGGAIQKGISRPKTPSIPVPPL